MKKLLILLFSILLSFNSYGEWTEITESIDGSSTFYVDEDTIKENGGYVYWWSLGNSKKLVSGTLSAKFYNEGDCGINRYRKLSYVFYKQPMGRGEDVTDNPQNPKWVYPTPGSIEGGVLDFVCAYVK